MVSPNHKTPNQHAANPIPMLATAY